MVYIALAAAFLLSSIVLSRKWATWKKASALTIVAVLTLAFLVILSTQMSFLGPADESWKADLVLFAALVLGMNSKYVWDLIDERQKANAKLPAGAPKAGLAFDFWDFVKPLLVSVIVFEAVAGTQHALNRTVIVISFQNGFFWQTVFQKKSR